MKLPKTLIKVFVLVIILLAILVIAIWALAPNIDSEIPQNTTDQNSSTNPQEQKSVPWALFGIIGAVVGAVFIAIFFIRKSGSGYSVLSDQGVKDYVRDYLLQHNFKLENKQGALYYYIPYFFAGDKRYPRALIGWNIFSDRSGIVPMKAHIVTLDINRRSPNYDTRLLSSMTYEEAETYVHKVQIGRTSSSPAPVKQDQIVISEAAQEAFEEAEKEKYKEAFK